MLSLLALLAAPAAAVDGCDNLSSVTTSSVTTSSVTTSSVTTSSVTTASVKIYDFTTVTTFCRLEPWYERIWFRPEFFVSDKFLDERCWQQKEYRHLCDEIDGVCRGQRSASCRLVPNETKDHGSGDWKQVECTNDLALDAQDFVSKANSMTPEVFWRSVAWYTAEEIEQLRRLHAGRILGLHETDEAEALRIVEDLKWWFESSRRRAKRRLKAQLKALLAAVDPALQLLPRNTFVIKCKTEGGEFKCEGKLDVDNEDADKRKFRKAETCNTALEHRLTGLPSSLAPTLCGQMQAGTGACTTKKIVIPQKDSVLEYTCQFGHLLPKTTLVIKCKTEGGEFKCGGAKKYRKKPHRYAEKCKIAVRYRLTGRAKKLARKICTELEFSKFTMCKPLPEQPEIGRDYHKGTDDGFPEYTCQIDVAQLE